MKKYGHMYPSCKDGAHGVLALFSFSDRSSWEEIPALVQRTVLPQDPITPIGLSYYSNFYFIFNLLLLKLKIFYKEFFFYK